jgi:hypothetical protein
VTRAYIRLDPSFDERKYDYPDGPYAALIATFCLAEHQPERGRFRSLDYLARLLGKRGRHASYLLEHGDLIKLPDGRCYLVGWDEWQEGDWKVGERVARIRNRKNGTEQVTPDVTVHVTPPVTVDVTVPVTPARLSAGGSAGVPSADKALAEQPPALTERYDPFDNPEQEALTWLSKHGCDIRPGNGYHQKLVVAVEHHGVNALVGMMDRLAAAGTKAGDTKGFLFGAIDALDKRSRPNLVEMEAEDRQGDLAADRQRRIERTKAENAALRAALESRS